jgi:hypothetical protein
MSTFDAKKSSSIFKLSFTAAETAGQSILPKKSSSMDEQSIFLEFLIKNYTVVSSFSIEWEDGTVWV